MFNWAHPVIGCMFLMLSLGCADDSKRRCLNSGDCPLPEVCIAIETDEDGAIVRGTCGIECRVDTDCNMGDFCVDSVCLSADRPCRTQDDCEPFGRTCIAGILRCVQRCTPQLPCPMGSYCEAGYCLPEGIDATLVSVDPEDAGTSEPLRQDQAVAQNRDASTSRRDSATPQPPQDMRVIDRAVPPPQDMAVVDMRLPPDMMIPTGEGYGGPCNRASDCASAICVPRVYTGQEISAGFCSQNCGRAADCPGLDSCGRLAGAGGSEQRVCVPNESGQSCQNATGAQCPYHGICNNPPNPSPADVFVEAQCSAECEQSSDCPAGYSCQTVATGPTTSRICTADVTLALCQGSADACDASINGAPICPNTTPATIAAVAHCLAMGPSGATMCSCECSSAADCPNGFACDRVTSWQEVGIELTSGRPGLCFPIAGYACNVDGSNCLNAQGTCVGYADTQSGLIRGVCSSPCINANDCPNGYACTFDPQVETSLCIPNY